MSQMSLEKRFGQSSVFVASTLMEYGGVPQSATPESLLKEAIHVISCGYEDRSDWGREVIIIPAFFLYQLVFHFFLRIESSFLFWFTKLKVSHVSSFEETKSKFMNVLCGRTSEMIYLLLASNLFFLLRICNGAVVFCRLVGSMVLLQKIFLPGSRCMHAAGGQSTACLSDQLSRGLPPSTFQIV